MTPASAQTEPAAATFTISYDTDVPAEVRAAVAFATEIWAQRVRSSVPIEVEVRWGGGLPRNVASSTEPAGYARVTPDGPLEAIALANAVGGYDREPGSPDIRMLLGSGIRWYTGIDGAAPASATDMVTMVLHELAHGLGFIGSFRNSDAELGWGRAAGGALVPLGLDAGLVDSRIGVQLTDGAAFANPSSALLDAATSGQISWGGGARDSHGRSPVMYAPATYEPHSSLVHFDDDAYPPGDPDALLTSLIKRGEVIHRIGPATLGVLHDLGWQVNAESDAAPVPRPQPALVRTQAAAAVVVTPTSQVPPPPAPPTSVVLLAAPPVPMRAATKRASTSQDRVRTDAGAVVGVIPLIAVALALAIARARSRAVS